MDEQISEKSSSSRSNVSSGESSGSVSSSHESSEFSCDNLKSDQKSICNHDYEIENPDEGAIIQKINHSQNLKIQQ